MSNFWQDILAEAKDEPIEAVVIGEMGWGDYKDTGTVPKEKRAVILDALEASGYLNYDYSTGFGAPECHAVYVYTATRILYVSQYDGATGVNSLSRNPTAAMPEMPGG